MSVPVRFLNIHSITGAACWALGSIVRSLWFHRAEFLSLGPTSQVTDEEIGLREARHLHGVTQQVRGPQVWPQ